MTSALTGRCQCSRPSNAINKYWSRNEDEHAIKTGGVTRFFFQHGERQTLLPSTGYPRTYKDTSLARTRYKDTKAAVKRYDTHKRGRTIPLYRTWHQHNSYTHKTKINNNKDTHKSIIMLDIESPESGSPSKNNRDKNSPPNKSHLCLCAKIDSQTKKLQQLQLKLDAA